MYDAGWRDESLNQAMHPVPPQRALLRLKVVELSWVRRERRPMDEGQIVAVPQLGWIFEVPLGTGRMHIAREETSG
jgi:hypothetical protein